jgi:tetratricopeptide (TPR) repeat protein
MVERRSLHFTSIEEFMATQSAAPRPRPAADADDAFLARAVEVSAWARKNIQLVVGVGVLLLVLVVGLLWYRADRANRLQQAATEFYSVQQMAEMGEYNQVVPELTTYIQRFDGTVYAEEARVLLGHVHLNANNPAEAANTLRPFAERVGRTPVAAQGALLLGAAYEAAGDTEAAARTYIAVADRADLLIEQQEALGRAAAVRQQAGDHAGAAEVLRRLAATAEEGTFERSVFEMRLAEAEAQAAAAQR